MKLTVRYAGGAVEAFDTGALTSGGPFGRANVLTDMHVRVEEGLWVDLSWYWMPDCEGADGMPLAQRQGGCRLHVLSADELARVRSVELDGRLQWLRVGPDLCDVTALAEAADLLYDPDEPSRCMQGKAAWLHDRLKDALPDVSARPDGEERLCSMLGMSAKSYGWLSRLSDGDGTGDDDYGWE